MPLFILCHTLMYFLFLLWLWFYIFQTNSGYRLSSCGFIIVVVVIVVLARISCLWVCLLSVGYEAVVYCLICFITNHFRCGCISVFMAVCIRVLHFRVINANMPFCGFTGILHQDISFALLCLCVCLAVSCRVRSFTFVLIIFQTAGLWGVALKGLYPIGFYAQLF